MDRFQNGNESKALALLVVQDFVVEATVNDGERFYTIRFNDPAKGHVDIGLSSPGMAQLCFALSKAAIATCDEGWLASMMVMMTETPEESVERLFESGHAKGNLEG